MATKDQVFRLHRVYPHWTAGMIAAELECEPAYVRSTFYRAGKDLPGPSKRSLAEQRERERCAKLAEGMGSALIAKAIRSGRAA